jgi:hypothetical protein
MSWWPWKKKDVESLSEPDEPEIILSDFDRVTNYFASGGKVIDVSNKPRLPNDGFPPDGELMQAFNEAHVGMKEGLSSLARGNKG